MGDHLRKTILDAINEPGWAERESKVEAKVFYKIIGKSKDGNEIHAARTSLEINAPPKVVADIILDVNSHKTWNVPTVADQVVLEQPDPRTQIIYQTHKTLSAVFIRRWTEENGGFFITATSTEASKTPPQREMHVRALLIYEGWQITPTASGCNVTYVSALDFGAWIHDKFVEGEVVRCAQRLTKIKAKALEKVGQK